MLTRSHVCLRAFRPRSCLCSRRTISKLYKQPTDLSALVESPHIGSTKRVLTDGPSLSLSGVSALENHTIAQSARVIRDTSILSDQIKGTLGARSSGGPPFPGKKDAGDDSFISEVYGTQPGEPRPKTHIDHWADFFAKLEKDGEAKPLEKEEGGRTNDLQQKGASVAYNEKTERRRLYRYKKKMMKKALGVAEHEDGSRSKVWRRRKDIGRPHGSLPPYSRRIEGLIQARDGPVLQDLAPPTKQKPIANLTHGLDRVLFHPGVYWLQDPRSHVYNFPPYLEQIPKVEDFAFEKLSGFISSSRDQDLWSLARAEKRTFAGSTSSLTGMLSQIYFLISGNREVDTITLSGHLNREPRNFTPGQRMPASVVFKHNDGVYAIDSDKDSPGIAERNILTWMGTLLEKFLTSAPDEFSALLRDSGKEVPQQELDENGQPMREAYRYAKSDRFVMRSQLDCQDSRLPGTGVFDIKTRAALPIRMDIMNHEENSGYLIRKQYGQLESFEREYYDLIRSAFLKYSFQVRIGNMDGVLVAYHNTARMFGFQYISLEEMEERLYGASNRGDGVFMKCVELLEVVADEAIRCFPSQSVKCTFETLEGSSVLSVWVQPAEWDGEEKERPIEQIDVYVNNYIGNDLVRGPKAVSAHAEPDAAPWTIHWTLCRSSAPQSDLHHALSKAKDRQFRAYNLPSGVSMDEMKTLWGNINYGGLDPEALVMQNGVEGGWQQRLFRKPDGATMVLRKMARQGREDSERRMEEMGGRKVVWGEPDVVLDSESEEVSDGGVDAKDIAPVEERVAVS